MTIEFQRRIYNAYKANKENTVQHGQYEYAIATNNCCTIRTWIVRRRINRLGGEWHWLQPLDLSIY
jgi:hypothetical protein